MCNGHTTYKPVASS